MTVNFWDKQAKKYEEAIRKHEADYRKTITAARSLLSASDVVLDLGCASGEYSLDIAPSVRCVHGIDPSANMIALATRKANERSIGNATFNAVDVFDRSLDALRFTAVMAFSVLHLVGEIGPVLARINKLLPAGGLFMSETPCMGEWPAPLRFLMGLAQGMKVVPPILSLTSRVLEAEIAHAGFDIVRSETWDRKKAIHWIVARKQ